MPASELEMLRPKARKPWPRNRLAFCSPPASQKPLAYSGLGWAGLGGFWQWGARGGDPYFLGL